MLPQSSVNKPNKTSLSEGKVKSSICHFQFFSPHERRRSVKCVGSACHRYCFDALVGPRCPASSFYRALINTATGGAPAGAEAALPAHGRPRCGCPASGGKAVPGMASETAWRHALLPLKAVFAPCQENSSLEKRCLLVKWTKSVNSD